MSCLLCGESAATLEGGSVLRPRAINSVQVTGTRVICGRCGGSLSPTDQGERVDFVGSFNLPPHIKYRMEELDFVETAANLAAFLAIQPPVRSLACELLRGGKVVKAKLKLG